MAREYRGKLYDLQGSGPVCADCALQWARGILAELVQTGDEGESCWVGHEHGIAVTRRNPYEVLGSLGSATVEDEIERVYRDCPEFHAAVVEDGNGLLCDGCRRQVASPERIAKVVARIDAADPRPRAALAAFLAHRQAEQGAEPVPAPAPPPPPEPLYLVEDQYGRWIGLEDDTMPRILPARFRIRYGEGYEYRWPLSQLRSAVRQGAERGGLEINADPEGNGPWHPVVVVPREKGASR